MSRIPLWYLNHPRLPFAERLDVLGLTCPGCGVVLQNSMSNRSTCAACAKSKATFRENARRTRIDWLFAHIHDPLTDLSVRDVILARHVAAAWADTCDRLQHLFDSCVVARDEATPEARIVIDAFMAAYRDANLCRATNGLIAFTIHRLRDLHIVKGTRATASAPDTNKIPIQLLQPLIAERG